MDEEASTKALTIKIANAGGKKPASSSVSSSPYNSPLVSPPSSAFVSALQSPYISPRAVSSVADAGDTPVPGEGSCPTPATSLTHPSPPVSCSGSQSDDLPSTSHTPPPEKPAAAAETAPRISFSFQIPRISFAKGSVSPASNAKLRSCDVYIGYHGQNPNLVRLCKWLKSELEIQGIACFVADRARYSDNQSHEIADRVISSVAHGVVVITAASLFNHLTLEEIRFFAQKKNLIPLFFDTDAGDIAGIFNPHTGNKEFKDALDGLMRFHEHKLEANDGNWRNCVNRAAGILRSKLGRKSVAGKEPDTHDKLPFPRNKHFLGREKELMDIESAFFGCGDYWDQEYNGNSHSGKTEPGPGQSDGLADGESEADGAKGKYISLEVGRCREPNLEAWVEPVISRSSLKRPKYKKTKSGKYKSFGCSSIVCINGSPGIGKTELALEFAYRYSQRYKMVLWVGGESRYFRQNILNLSVSMGLDVSAEEERDRGRIRSFDEQESEAFKRVKRELFRDTPYLLVIDNLESEKEWWEGKDLHDLIPRNTGGTNVIIATRLSRVMTLEPMHLHPLPLPEAMTLIRGRRRREYPTDELAFLAKFDEKLGRSGFGISVVGSLLSELSIGPSALFEAVSRVQVDESPPPTSPFLTKVLSFCADVLERTGGARNALSSRMLRVGPWFAPGPVPSDLLAAAASHVPSSNGRKKWAECVGPALSCFFAGQTWKCGGDNDSAQLLVRLGLARRAIRVGQPGQLWIQFHPTAREFAKWRYGGPRGGPSAAKATVQGVRKIGSPIITPDHMWATAFLVFGFKNEPPHVQLKPAEMVLFIKRTAIPLAIQAFTAFSRCNSALELLKVCTNVLEEIEKSFVCQLQDWCHGSLCWKKKKSGGESSGVDEHVWQEVTLLKAALLETRAKLLIRGGNFDSGEELCRTCISIRTVMLGHNHGQTLAAQETLAKLVRMRSKI
ncbi:P-loop containing nucleoside triphosphate hydrolases superfamily protein [Striga hermonthica]|uniref:P-loop containing nucleoside triphosphate hydrolases superfamily protein n=1 Tax=Striga hermonthica TaxID=68872 RepID=A0A9N7RTE0_STRHE|nr:P-loop containing nucleoside triphosphate hydrolases superfamily protein [Striga hermonthica]